MRQAVTKAFSSKKTIFFSIFGTILFLTVIVVGILVVYPSKNFQWRSLVNSFLETVSFKQKSYARINYTENTVNLTFDIAPDDMPRAVEFSRKLNIKQDWVQGVSITLDQKTVNLLKGNLPEKINLKFEDSGISFSSPSSPLLKSSLSGRNYQIATVSGSLVLNVSSERDYDLKIIEPAAVLKYADTSGKLYLSQKAQGFLPLLEKIARIEIESRNGEVKGKVEF